MTKAKATSDTKQETKAIELADASLPDNSKQEDVKENASNDSPTNKTESNKAATDAKTDSGTAAQPAAAQEKKRGGGAFLSFAALVIAGGAFAAGYAALQQINQQQTALSDRINSTEQTVATVETSAQNSISTANQAKSNADALSGRIASLENKINSSLGQVKQTVGNDIAQLNNEITQLKETNSALSDTVTKLSETLKQKQDDEWLAAEARLLIKIANHQAQLNYNAKAAMAALEAADHRLRDAADPALLPVRQSLTDNIIALRAVNELDITGVAVTLNQLENRVAELAFSSTVKAVEPKTPAATEETTDDGTLSSIEQFASRIWADIKGLVSIRHDDSKTSAAMLPPGQQFFLQQNLRLKLETARLALLQRDTKTFQDTLNTATQWLKTYFDTDTVAVANMINSLAPYEHLELQPQIPDISSSLRALDNWQQQRNASTTPTSNTQESAS